MKKYKKNRRNYTRNIYPTLVATEAVVNNLCGIDAIDETTSELHDDVESRVIFDLYKQGMSSEAKNVLQMVVDAPVELADKLFGPRKYSAVRYNLRKIQKWLLTKYSPRKARLILRELKELYECTL